MFHCLISAVSSTALTKWIPKLNKLQELKLFDGQALAAEGIPELVNKSCPHFRKLGMFFWYGLINRGQNYS